MSGVSLEKLKIKTWPDEQPIATFEDMVDLEKAVGRHSEGNQRKFSPL